MVKLFEDEMSSTSYLQTKMDEFVAKFRDTCINIGNDNVDNLAYQVPYLSQLARHYEDQEDWASLVRVY
jgi:hypothetical protein